MLPFINYDYILDKNIVFYAHTYEGRKETLEEHIGRCEKYFQILYEHKNIELILKRLHQNMHFHNENASFDFLKDLLIQLVTFHDFGKINPSFQKVKMDNKIENNYDGLINQDHSFLSSLIYLDYFLNKLDRLNEISSNDKIILERVVLEHAYIISRHHSDLENMTKFLNQLSESQTKRLIANLRIKPIQGYKRLIYLDDRKLSLLIRHFYHKKNQDSSYEYSLKYFYYRLAYSLLVVSDYYATSEFMNQNEFDIIGKKISIQDFQQEYNQSKLLKSIRNYEKEKYQGVHKNFNNITNINDLRNELFLDAETNLFHHLDKAIYFLEAPTGSGKSNIAFNLSFHLMKDRKKLFYIYPFNTLVEQNQNSLNNLFDKQELQKQIVVVNSLTPLPDMHQNEEDSKQYYQKVLLDRQFLNYPLILSTHVSFFN